jgi:hypothetical protein
MVKVRALGLTILLGLAASACSTLPDLPTESGLRTSEIISRVKCELRQVLITHPEHHAWLLKWAAGFNLTMKVKERAGASAGTDYVWPIPLGTFRLSLGASLSEDATRIAQFKLSLPLTDALDFPCPEGPDAGPTDRTLTGNIGLAEWMDEAVKAVAASQSEKQFNGLGHTLEFFLQATGNISPSWAIVRASGRRYNPGFGISGQREATNTLEVALAKIPSNQPQRVFVTNWPEGVHSFSDESRDRSVRPRTRALRSAPSPRGGGGVDPETQRRLDDILQGLQFRNLQLDR